MRGLLPLLLSLAACESTAIVTLPEAPAGARAWYLGVKSPTGFELRAIELHEDASTSLRAVSRELEGSEGLRLELVADERSLASRGLAPGVVPAVTSTQSSALPAGKVRRLELVAGAEPGPWIETEERSAELSSFRFARPAGGCFDFAPRAEPLESLSAELAVEIEPDVLFVSTREAAYLVTREGRTRVASDRLIHARDAVVVEPGVAWLATYDGHLVRARLGERIEILEDVTTDAWELQWVASSPDPSARDVFAMTYDGIVVHYDGVRVERVATFEPFQTTNDPAGGLAWVGPREAIVAYPSVRGVPRVRYDASSGLWESMVEEPEGARAAFLTARGVPGVGPMVGNSEGQFFALEGGRWRELPGSPIRVFIFSIAPFRDGFVYGTSFGNFGQYTSRDGFCPPYANAQAQEVRVIAGVASGAVFIAGPRKGLQPTYTWMEPR